MRILDAVKVLVMEKYLADTTILIEHLRGNLQAKNFLLNSNVAISTVTIAELIQGTKIKTQLSIVEMAVNDLTIYSINENADRLAIDLMKKFFHSHHLLFLDALIAAIAITFSLTLITANIRHFQMIKELSIIPWPVK